jgi:hypothetical protein
MNVIINFITKNKEIFLLIVLLLSVLVLFKYKLKEGHTNSDSDTCELDYTNEILEVMTRYLDVNNKMWSKLIEINNFYQEFQDEMKVHGMTASHEKTCGNGDAVLPIDIAQKYMTDSEEFLIGDGGAYELFVEHTKLFDELKAYKADAGTYKTSVIVDRTEYDPNVCLGDDCERGAWKGLEGNDPTNPVTFDPEQLIGEPADNVNNIKTYVYQACSVSEYIVGEIWKHCADSICQQMNSACDGEINNLTNKWTFDKTKICRGANYKCPGSTNAFMSYIGMPKPGLSTTIYVDPALAAPTKDCPDARSQEQLIDCYYGNKDTSVNGSSTNTNSPGSHTNYWQAKTDYESILSSIVSVTARKQNQTTANAKAEQARLDSIAAAETVAEEEAAATIDNCNSYTFKLTDTMNKFGEVDGRAECIKWRDSTGWCSYGDHERVGNKKQKVTCKKTNEQNLGIVLQNNL